MARIKECWEFIRTRVSTAFLISLGLSFIFWYSGKLQHTYTTDIPLTIVLDGEEYRVRCVVEGTGHSILSARYFDRPKVKLTSSDVTIVPVEGEEDVHKVTPESLQNAISLRYSEIKINAVATTITLD